MNQWHQPHQGHQSNQRGFSLVHFTLIIVLLGILLIEGMKIIPTVTEYFSIKKTIMRLKEAGGSAAEIRAGFDRQASAGYISSITSEDLEIIGNGINGGEVEISVAYEKRIPLFKPVSLVIEYAASTSTSTHSISKKAPVEE